MQRMTRDQRRRGRILRAARDDKENANLPLVVPRVSEGSGPLVSLCPLCSLWFFALLPTTDSGFACYGLMCSRRGSFSAGDGSALMGATDSPYCQ